MKRIFLLLAVLASISVYAQKPQLFPQLDLGFYENNRMDKTDTTDLYFYLKNVKGGFANHTAVEILVSNPDILLSGVHIETGHIGPGKDRPFLVRLLSNIDSTVSITLIAKEHYGRFGDTLALNYVFIKADSIANDSVKAKEPAKITTMNVKVDQLFSVQLNANITAGYTWEPIGEEWKEFAELTEKKYQPAVNSGMMIGVGGKEVFTFKAKAEGECYIEFEYRNFNKEFKGGERKFKVRLNAGK